mmetsp:Transcript_24036/g.66777  ORF Transcript_24036/g.66777 Transcript_24036/m.66777 type:complete len:180 (-) Transcript_24036:354-893(-)
MVRGELAAEPGQRCSTLSAQAVLVALQDGSMASVRLSDGAVRWRQQLQAGPLNNGVSSSMPGIGPSEAEAGLGKGLLWVVSSEGTVAVLQEQLPMGESPKEVTAADCSQTPSLAEAVAEVRTSPGENAAALAAICEVAGVQLPDRSFTSPVVAGPLALVGCRDNHLYCLAFCHHGAPPW